MNTPGRPKASPLTRQEQLRRAKRAQRARQRAAGVVSIQLETSAPMAKKLSVARRSADFMRALDATLDRLVVHVADYPQLRDLMWNRSDEFILAREAFALYERNWRHIDIDRLDTEEYALLERLKKEFGNGVING